MEKTKTDADILLTVLDELDITAGKLAKKMEITPASLYHIKEGRNNMSRDLAFKIKEAYPQVSFDFLVKGTGEAILKRSAMIQAESNILFDVDPKKNNKLGLDDIPNILGSINNNLERIADALENK